MKHSIHVLDPSKSVNLNSRFRFPSPPTSWSVERVGLLTASQPAATHPAAASQPAKVASGHRSLRPPGLDVSKLFYRGIQSDGTGCHRPPQGGTGRQTFWHPQHQRAAKYATNPSNIDDMATFPTNRVMGRPFHEFRVPIQIL